MKWHVSLVALALWLAGILGGQAFFQSRDSNYNQNIATTAGYTGPGDIQTFTFWGGVRAYSAATAGTKAIQVCNVADVACADLSTDASTGALVVSTIGGSNCAIVTCTVKTIYDKVGTADCTQATIANRPVFTQNALNSSWGMTFTAASTQSFSCGTFTGSQPLSLVGVFKPSGATGEIFDITDGSFGGIIVEWQGGASAIRMYAGSTIDVTTTSAFHAFQGIFNGVSSISANDGVETTGNVGAQNLSALTMTIGNAAFNSPADLVGMEFGYVNGTINGGNRTSLNTNMHAAYGSW